ncbi:MAG TPA: bacillithiol biosynthesis BshC, partial [Crocinitomix sp.]|nr:bacillithiol biosynthesis BshC [Crocinitomix sp.]
SVSLKKLFQPVIEKELTQKLTFNAVYKTNTNLKKSGYHNQVFLREYNLFYIKGKTVRHRIIRAEEGFKINNEFKTTHQLIEESKQYPERFSPNALLRPIYQELVLPNIAYIGGGGEIAYWLQIKGVFKQLNLTMPLLRVRDSYILLNSNQISKLKTLNLSIIDLKQNYDDLAKFYIRNNTTCDLSLRSEKEILTQLKTSILNKIDSNEIGLHRFVEAEMVKTNHQLEKIEKKLLQNEKKKQAQALNQIKKLKDKVYPDNGFQERQENFLQYIHIPNFIDYLKKELDLLTNDQAQIHLLKIKFYHANNGKFAIN